MLDSMMESIQRLLAKRSPLKAREIAKDLGLERREVNILLHRHSGQFQSDESHRWSLIHNGSVALSLPERWVNAETFEATLKGAGDVLYGTHRFVTVFFPHGCKLMIDCTARILSLMNQLIFCGKSVTLDFTASEATLTYLNRAGFFDHLDGGVNVLPYRPTESAATKFQGQSDTLVEFGSVDLRTTNDGLIAALTEKFVQQSTDAYRVAAFTVFAELINNVKEHSKSPLKGFAGLQKYGGSRKHIQTIVSDSGVGIAKTLRPALQEHYPPLFAQFGSESTESDIGLVIAAMSAGNISRFGGARGLGFKSSREQAMKFHANFSVRQETFSVRFDYRNGELVQTTPQEGLSNISGTHICFDFFV